MRALVWLRRDCRVHDNPALFQACAQATDGVLAVYILTPETWQQHHYGSNQLAFLRQALISLSDELKTIHIPLLIRLTPTFQQVPEIIAELMQKHHCEDLYFNHQYEWDERQRDHAVAKLLASKGLSVTVTHDQVMIPPEYLKTQQGKPFQVFTAYKKQWLHNLRQFDLRPLAKPKPVLQTIDILADEVPTRWGDYDFNQLVTCPLPKADEKSAIAKLRSFVQQDCNDYAIARDFPARDQTSRLSPYLALGILSVRQCLARVLVNFEISDISVLLNKSGASVWCNELIWRDFYKMILYCFPRVSKNQAFQLRTDQLPWRHDIALFKQWCDGQTGFPLVDAAMRQLKQTGWMHNRLRMLVAMFLTKLLFIDWRWGERYFAEQLLDHDLSANNGGWQWSASTGTDAAPYFRVFNPITQSERFDPDGTFIRQYCPELADLDNKSIHDPRSGQLRGKYPAKIIDYREQRVHVIEMFKNNHFSPLHTVIARRP